MLYKYHWSGGRAKNVRLKSSPTNCTFSCHGAPSSAAMLEGWSQVIIACEPSSLFSGRPSSSSLFSFSLWQLLILITKPIFLSLFLLFLLILHTSTINNQPRFTSHHPVFHHPMMHPLHHPHSLIPHQYLVNHEYPFSMFTAQAGY